ncbi:MAG TPA: sugar phosphate nucleotidyltransferase [Patescibacteria group bacterium]|jgi:mannose-1-phosphate guanylyltransferase|nr:sugar phosphate nucleotidyltransferase [Patescibacteria group bacterium]
MKQVAIILAGGKGTRLWPLSDRLHPKPLIEIFNKRPMFEETLLRAKLFSDDIFVLTNQKVGDLARKLFLKSGIARAQVIIEPSKADTGAAIPYAIAHIRALFGEDTTITLLPVDHLIKNYGAFYRDIKYATKIAASHSQVTLFGVTPSFASTGYGYMKLGPAVEHEDRDMVFVVDNFLEKPDEEKASQFLKSADYVWNSGIYIGTIDAFENVFRKNSLIFKWYLSLQTNNGGTTLPHNLQDIQFERGLIEHMDSLLAVIATFDWMDIGTYSGLYSSSSPTDDSGNAVQGNARAHDCHDCLIMGNHKRIVALGLDDIAIIDGPDGILVCKKSTHAQLVGKIAVGESQPGDDSG